MVAKKISRSILGRVRNLYIRFYRMFHQININNVTFISFGGKSYSDNPRAISEKLHEICQDINITWILDNVGTHDHLIPHYVNIVEKKQIWKFWKSLATTAAFVTNEKCYYIPKSNRQLFINTWHGDRAFKKIMFDCVQLKATDVPESIPGYCDLVTVGSDYGEMQFRSAFKYQGEILKYGCPRNDVLINVDEIRNSRTKSILGINNSTSVLLYAPTLRKASAYNKNGQKMQDIDLENIAKILEDRTHRKWVVLIRAHPIVTTLNINFDNNIFIDATHYDDMADLLAVSDFLITDYSSCAGDFALTGRPILLFQNDIAEYEKNERGFYFKMEESPYFTAHTQEEAEKVVEEMTLENAQKNCADILKFYNTYESGEASKVLAERIVKHLKSLRLE